MNSLFIGLGGFGTKTLDCLCHKTESFNNNFSKQNRLGIDAYYYYIDTDRTLYNQSPERFLPGSDKCFHTIGNYSPDQIIGKMQRGETEKYDLLKKWYDAPPKMTNMGMGADVIRQYARLAFSSEALSIRNELILLIQLIQQNGHINVITSYCGGTGSGIYMDLLYMISEIYEYLGIPSTQTDVRLIMAMPEGYISNGYPLDIANMKMRLNSYRIDDYRYFESYKEFAERYIKVGRNYNPFIDKRFLGKPDKDGKYPCDVNATLEKIAEEKVG